MVRDSNVYNATSRSIVIRNEGLFMQQLIATLLQELGYDPQRDSLRKTPARVAKALTYLTEGVRIDPQAILREALFAESYDGLVTVGPVPFHSLCEHHLLPFFGQVHVGYLPSGTIVGLSKIPRAIDACARRLQVQERLTRDIADAVTAVLRPRGLAVTITAEHMCVQMRGIRKAGTGMTTSIMTGALRDDAALRDEFLRGCSHAALA